MTVVRLAVVFIGVKRVLSAFGLEHTERPSILVSNYHLKPFIEHRDKMGFRDWSLDSGAFSAHMSGAQISLPQYIKTCRHFMATDPSLTEMFSLDVIGDWKASLKNCEAMWKAGVPAIPTYHRGEPLHVLKEMARQYPKIALGGVARMPVQTKIKWAGQCFSHVWPKRIHGLGFGSEQLVLGLPFHSVDATSWLFETTGFYRWHAYNGRFPLTGSDQQMRPEVEWYLRLEARARAKWGRELARMEPKKQESA